MWTRRSKVQLLPLFYYQTFIMSQKPLFLNPILPVTTLLKTASHCRRLFSSSDVRIQLRLLYKWYSSTDFQFYPECFQLRLYGPCRNSAKLSSTVMESEVFRQEMFHSLSSVVNSCVGADEGRQERRQIIIVREARWCRSRPVADQQHI